MDIGITKGTLRWLAAAAIATTSFSAAAYEGGKVDNGGSVHGRVVFKGKAPTPKMMKVTQDPDVCGAAPIASESIQVGAGGGLRNAVVWIEGIKKGKPLPSKPATRLDNAKCRFVPHVQAVVRKTSLTIGNKDDTLHNTHGRLMPKKVTVFNLGMPIQGQEFKEVLDVKGLIRVGCDAGHTWMSAYIWVFEHPYFAVSKPDGSFAIDGLPPGTYEVRMWHETLGTRKASVTVSAGKKASLDFTVKR